MTIAFPREFPLLGCFTEACVFEPVYQQTRNITGGGTPDVADVGPMMWHGVWRTTLLSRSEFGEWDAWLDSLRGGLRTFKGRPNRHRWPMTYPRGFDGLTVSGSAFSGNGNLSAIGSTRDIVTINQVPTGFKLLPGDWFSIAVSGKQRLHKVTEGATALSTGFTISCEPTIEVGVSTGIAVKFFEPYCDMVLTKSDRQRDANRGGSISFEGMQVLI